MPVRGPRSSRSQRLHWQRVEETTRNPPGFRNVAVHDYQKLNLDIVKAVIREHLGDLRDFSKAMVLRYG